jgi:hypothetical protein
MAGSVKVVIKSVFDDKELKRASRDFANATKGIRTLGLVAGAAFIGAAAVTVKFGASAIKAAEDVATANARLAQINTSMGLFGASTQTVTNRLIKYAEANEIATATDAESIKATQAKLLTFKELALTADEAGGAFDRATMAAIDLAAAGFGEAETNAVQLGKALNDPIKGITALGRAGITFTETEKAKIRTLVESNQMLAAQELILVALETQVGGTAVATANASDKIALAFENISKQVGAALLPAFEQAVDELIAFAPAIADGLVPVAENLADIFQTRVLPAIQDFTNWLSSPEGTQAITDFAGVIVDTAENLVDFGQWFADNLDTIARMAVVIGLVTVAAGALDVIIKLATISQLLFNKAVLKNPYVIAAVAIAGLAGAVFVLTGKMDSADIATAQLAENTRSLKAQQIDLNKKIERGGVNSDAYRFKLRKVEQQLNDLENATRESKNELIRFGRIQAGITRPAQTGSFAERMYQYEQEQKALKELAELPTPGGTPTGGTPKATPDADKETRAERFAKVQKVIQDTQKKILEAESSYAGARFQIQQDYENRVTELRKNAADKQLDIVRDSIGRLTSAFKSATQISLGELFDTRQVSEIQTTVRKLTSSLTLSITKETSKTVSASVDDLIASLSDKLKASKQLLANSGELASAGFSQTFIEQVVETGTETGNALASAILGASPETQRQLQKLFVDLENVSGSGMDKLAREIYDSMGLATTALKTLYTQVSVDLNTALADEQKTLVTKLAEAASAFAASIADIKAGFLSDLAQFDGAFAGLGSTIDAVLAKLAALTGGAIKDVQAALTDPGAGTVLASATVQNNVALKNLGNAQGIVVDSVADVAGTAAYLEARIKAANTFIKSSSSNAVQEASARNTIAGFTTQLADLRGSAAAGSAVGTVININVKTDSTQSAAMVGQTIGKVVSKYTTTGGSVLVSGRN